MHLPSSKMVEPQGLTGKGTASLSGARYSRAIPRCSKVVEGGEQRWRKVCKGRSSDQLVGIYTWVTKASTIFKVPALHTHCQVGLLLDDISHLRRANREWLEGRGRGLKVPSYLRFDGQVGFFQF